MGKIKETATKEPSGTSTKVYSIFHDLNHFRYIWKEVRRDFIATKFLGF